MRSEEEILNRIYFLEKECLVMQEDKDCETSYWRGRIKVYQNAISVLLWVLKRAKDFTLY